MGDGGTPRPCGCSVRSCRGILGGVKQGEFFPTTPEARERVFELEDAEVRLREGFLSPQESESLFEEIRQDTPWEQERLVMYGKEVLAPRLTAWYGDRECVYRYSGVEHVPLKWTPQLDRIRQRVVVCVGEKFNSVLLNYYRDGQDSVSWHGDDEPHLGPVIASLSLGEQRTFQLKHKQRTDLPRVDIELPPGSLLVMSGDCQLKWRHQLPKRRGSIGPRINLTFRVFDQLDVTNRSYP